MYTSMSEEERLKFLEDMRLFKTKFADRDEQAQPQEKKEEVKQEESSSRPRGKRPPKARTSILQEQISAEWKRVRAENEAARRSFEEKVRRETAEDFDIGADFKKEDFATKVR